MTEAELIRAYGGSERQFDLERLLDRAALEGRQGEPEDTSGHAPEPPAMRCQRCGLAIAPRLVDFTGGWQWTHVLGGDDE